MRSLLRPLTPVLFSAILANAAHAADPAPAAGDAARGKTLFQQSCAICHATGLADRPQAGQGPLLAGVVGRQAGSLNSFGYTKALVASHLTWDATTLDKFLTAPTAVVPGTNMVIPTPNATDRGDLIAFLSTLKAIAPTEEKVAPPHERTAGDWENDAPGNVHRIRTRQATRTATPPLLRGNSPKTVDRPTGALPVVPAGLRFK